MAAVKVALITASSAGLGAQIARVFAPDFRVVRSHCSQNRQRTFNDPELSD
jgi:NAD(P)-dependent dehydrogenase (short-subunit alcohol dehydrogenase family)